MMNCLNHNNRDWLLSQMEKVRYVTSYELLQNTRFRKQVQARRPSKWFKMRAFYCDKNFYDNFQKMIFDYMSIKNKDSANIFVCAGQPCPFLQNFFENKRQEVYQEIDILTQSLKSIEFLKTWQNNEVLNKKYLNLLNEWHSNWIKQCNIDCKYGIISTSGINNFIYKFEDNLIVCNFNANNFTASDNRVLRWSFINNLNWIRTCINYELDEVDIINDMMDYLRNDACGLLKTLTAMRYDPILNFAKANIICRLEQFYYLNKTIENSQLIKSSVYNDEKTKIQRETIFSRQNTVRGNHNCAILLKTLFTITDGYKDKFDALAKMMAEIVIGKKLGREFELNISQAAIIKTNNTTFVRQFLLNIFIGLGINQMKIRQNLSVNIVHGVTQYSASQLADAKMTGKFIEDKVCSKYLNITDKLKFNNTDECKKHLANLVNGRVVKGKNEYLGKQKISSDMYYVFLASSQEDVSQLPVNDCNIVDFGKHIPDNIYFMPEYQEDRIKQYNALNDYEIKFMLASVANYGLELLLKDKQENIKQKSSNVVIKNPIEFFIKKCCTVVDNIEEDTKPNASNATVMITFQTAYNFFYEIANNIYANKEFNKNIEKEEGFAGKVVKARCNDVRERDLKKGYAETEVFAKDSRSNHCLGIVVKSKEDIKNIALEYKKSSQGNIEKLSKEEFVDFMIDLNCNYPW